MDSYYIERMSISDVEKAVAWAANEGWNPGLDDATCFFQTDPNGFFAGKLNNKIIAMGSAVIYDDQFAFCGLYMVDKTFRHLGYGLALTKARLNYIGGRNAGIDGVMAMCPKYERLGYRFAHQNARYHIPLVGNVATQFPITPITQTDFVAIVAYDALHFPARRESFLQNWLFQPNGYALCYKENDQVRGYGVIRACQQGFKIGPLFAQDPLIADALLKQLACYANGASIYMDIPENNAEALALINRYKGQKVFETARMYLKGAPNLPMEQIYGITSFELG